MQLLGPKIIIALDNMKKGEVLELLNKLSPDRCRVKVGSELFTLYGPTIIELIHRKGYEIFLDLKFHDIPNTVHRACLAAANLNVWMISIHLSGGFNMLRSAREAIDSCTHKPILMGVSVLTSLDDDLLRSMNFPSSNEMVKNLTHKALETNLDGVVCSPLELSFLKKKYEQELLLITPGIKLSNMDNDQRRTSTAQYAYRNGANAIVIGRLITRQNEPLKALQKIEMDMIS